MSDFGEPWNLVAVEEWGLCLTERGHAIIAYAPQSSPWQRRDLERARTCVTALAGINDPAAFVERAKAAEVLLRRAKLWPHVEGQGASILSTLDNGDVSYLASEWKPE